MTVKNDIIDGIIKSIEKRWVPYEGPKGGEGWLNTRTHNVRYQTEKPQEPSIDGDLEVSEDDLDRSGIHGINEMESASPDNLQIGDEVEWYDPQNDYTWEGEVTNVTDNVVVFETNDDREIQVPVDSNGDPKGSLRRERIAFFGDGVASADHSWLPEGEQATDNQLKAEALRAAAATDRMGEIEPLVEYASHALERDEGEERIEESIRFALDKHPYLGSERTDDIMDNADSDKKHMPQMNSKAANSPETLEIKDYYRIYLKSPEDAPDHANVRFTEDAPGGSSWFYEIPFSTSTTIELSKDESLEKIESESDYPDDNALEAIGVPERDFEVLRMATESIEDNEKWMEKESLIPRVESPVTLLRLYKEFYDGGERYSRQLDRIKAEFYDRGIVGVQRISKARNDSGRDGNREVE